MIKVASSTVLLISGRTIMEENFGKEISRASI
jgi:hypothetical protein